MQNYIRDVVHHFDNVSDRAEDIAVELGYEVIDYGEDWLEYGLYQKAAMILKHTEEGFYLRLNVVRYPELHGLGYYMGGLSENDVEIVEPRTVEVVKYFPVK